MKGRIMDTRKDGDFLFFSVSLVAAILDQLSKFAVILFIKNPVEILPFFSITYHINTGAAFGILQQQTIFLTLISIVFIAAVLYYRKRIDYHLLLPTALIVGGALGNLVDRLLRQGVVDFIDIGIWPAFNLADSSITVGALWLIMKYKKKK